MDVVVDDIRYGVVEGGAITMYAVVELDGEQIYVKLPNPGTTQKLGIWIGDSITIKKLIARYAFVKKAEVDRPIDATPPVFPTKCPCCNSELTVEVKRLVQLKCTAGCNGES